MIPNSPFFSNANQPERLKALGYESKSWHSDQVPLGRFRQWLLVYKVRREIRAANRCLKAKGQFPCGHSPLLSTDPTNEATLELEKARRTVDRVVFGEDT